MIELLVTILLFLIIIYVIYLAINFIVARMSLPSEVQTILYIVLGLIALLFLLDILGLYSFDGLR